MLVFTFLIPEKQHKEHTEHLNILKTIQSYFLMKTISHETIFE
jgi:hypothetical protein